MYDQRKRKQTCESTNIDTSSRCLKRFMPFTRSFRRSGSNVLESQVGRYPNWPFRHQEKPLGPDSSRGASAPVYSSSLLLPQLLGPHLLLDFLDSMRKAQRKRSPVCKSSYPSFVADVSFACDSIATPPRPTQGSLKHTKISVGSKKLKINAFLI